MQIGADASIFQCRPILLKVRQAKPGGVGSHVKENATENF
jgi:hypothetical protein